MLENIVKCYQPFWKGKLERKEVADMATSYDIILKMIEMLLAEREENQKEKD